MLNVPPEEIKHNWKTRDLNTEAEAEQVQFNGFNDKNKREYSLTGGGPIQADSPEGKQIQKGAGNQQNPECPIYQAENPKHRKTLGKRLHRLT